MCTRKCIEGSQLVQDIGLNFGGRCVESSSAEAHKVQEPRVGADVHAKTGTVDRSHALSGYVTTTDGKMLLFSFQANNYTVPNTQVERVQDWIAAQLAGAPFMKR